MEDDIVLQLFVDCISQCVKNLVLFCGDCVFQMIYIQRDSSFSSFLDILQGSAFVEPFFVFHRIRPF